MRQIDLLEFVQMDLPTVEHPMLINIRGCNGAGKSTVPMRMQETDPNTFEVTWMSEGKCRVIATVFPQYQFIALGHYHAKTGGLDTLKSTQEVKDAVEILWDTKWNILLEGILASTVRQTYIDLFSKKRTFQREIIIFNILPPIETCLQRIQQRNGGKSIKDQLVKDKWNTVEKNVEYFLTAGFTTLTVDNTNIRREDTLDWFFGLIGQKNDSQSSTQSLPNSNDSDPSFPIYIEPVENLKKYDWYPDYKEPVGIRINPTYWNNYWNFIAERMNIWHKRVILKEPPPWTDDPILQNFKFTNVIRDLDRLSLYERKHILAKMDEIQDDWSEWKIVKWKQSVLLNIMIFRLWVKIDTYEVHGFIDLTELDWKTKWEESKLKLLKRREDGISNFTAAYYVNDLRGANPDPDTRSNKTQNAICMIEGWMNQIDRIYDEAIVKAKNMKEQMAFFRTLPCVGDFTAYEYACSIAEIPRYCKNHMVNWTQDNATNVGPGAHRGINWIFEDKGNLNDYQCILYLRSIWKHELQRINAYDMFIQQLPKELNGDIDLRVIEHCLCETQKYNKAATNTGRPKESFKPKTIDINELKG